MRSPRSAIPIGVSKATPLSPPVMVRSSSNPMKTNAPVSVLSWRVKVYCMIADHEPGGGERGEKGGRDHVSGSVITHTQTNTKTHTQKRTHVRDTTVTICEDGSVVGCAVSTLP